MSATKSKLLIGKVHPSRIKFEDILESIGPAGLAQVIIFLIAAVVDTAVGWMVMSVPFGGDTPTFHCLSQVAVDGGATLESIQWDTLANSSSLLWTTDVCSVNGSACAAVVFEPDFASIVTEFSLVCQLQYVSTLVTTIFMLGILIGSFMAGHVADIYGRRITFYVLLSIIVVCLYIQGLSMNWQMLAVVRFFGGLSAGGMIPTAYVIQMEFVGPKYRTFCGALGFWQLGMIALAGLGHAVRSWRHLSFTVAGMSTPLLIIMFLVPESPRWLIQRGRLKEASAIIERMAKHNKHPHPGYEIIQSVDTDNYKSLVSIRDMFRNRASTIKTLLLCLMWVNCTLAHCGLSRNLKDIGGNALMNSIVLGATEFIFMISVIFTTWRFGRKPPLLVYFAVAILCHFIVVALGNSNTHEDIVAGIRALGRGAIAGAWATTILLTAETFPTVIRSLSCGIASTIGGIGGAIIPQIAHVVFLDSAVPGAVLGISSSVALLLGVMFLPETKGKPLPDTLPPIIGCFTPESNGDSKGKLGHFSHIRRKVPCRKEWSKSDELLQQTRRNMMRKTSNSRINSSSSSSSSNIELDDEA